MKHRLSRPRLQPPHYMTFQNKQKLEIRTVLALILIIVIGGGFLTWYYKIDGVYVDRVLEFRDGVNPLKLQTTQKEYRRGEMVAFLTNFCKTRDAKGAIQWTLANDRLIFFAPSDFAEAPISCYPTDVHDRIAKDIFPVPLDAKYGEHYFTAVITHVLPDGRIRKEYLKTEPFTVIP